MKRYVSIFYALIFVLCCASCTVKLSLPESVTIDGKEYKKAFVNELAPLYDEFSNVSAKKIAGKSYYPFSKTSFDCYFAYDYNADSNIFFESTQFDEAVSYYSNIENFNFFCILGSLYEENGHLLFELEEIDYSMFEQLIEFAELYAYNPLTSFNKTEGLKEIPVPNPDDWMEEEVYFYRDSKDGAFTIERHAFILHEREFYLLYRYDFTNEEAPIMLVRDVPEFLEDYFCELIENLQSNELPR